MRRVVVVSVLVLLVSGLATAQTGADDRTVAERADGFFERIFLQFSQFSQSDCDHAEVVNFDYPDSAQAGDRVTLDATVENTGSCSFDLIVEIDADLDLDGVQDERVCRSSRYTGPGGRVTCSDTVTMPSDDLEISAFAVANIFIWDDVWQSVSLESGGGGGGGGGGDADTQDPSVDVDAPGIVSPGERFTYTVTATDNDALDVVSSYGDHADTKLCGGSTSCVLENTVTAPDEGSWEVTGEAVDQAGNTDSSSESVRIGSPEASVSATFERVVFTVWNDITEAFD